MTGLLDEMRAHALLSEVRAILQQLKDGEITREEADEKAAELHDRINQLPPRRSHG